MSLLRDTWNVLAFRLTPRGYEELRGAHLALGVLLAWAAGYGRWWDHHGEVDPLLSSGAVSVLIVFALGTVLHGVLAPLRPERGGWLQTTAYVGLTSPLAALYALPLEAWMDVEAARVLNLVFLAIVSLWRVALLVRLARGLAGLGVWCTTVACLTPLALTVFALTLGGLLMDVFKLMAGADHVPRPAETRYEVIASLGMASIAVGPFFFLAWLHQIVVRRRGVAHPGSDA